MRPRSIVKSLRSNAARRKAVALRRDSGSSRETSLGEEVCVGAIIGCTACVALAWHFSPLVVALAAVAGLGSGSVIGLLLWSPATDSPDPAVGAVAAVQQRNKSNRPAAVFFCGRRSTCAHRRAAIHDRLQIDNHQADQ